MRDFSVHETFFKSVTILGGGACQVSGPTIGGGGLRKKGQDGTGPLLKDRSGECGNGDSGKRLSIESRPWKHRSKMLRHPQCIPRTGNVLDFARGDSIMFR